LLYAGTTSFLNFNYSFTLLRGFLVKKLKFWSLSAGNLLLSGTSETLRNEILSFRTQSTHLRILSDTTYSVSYAPKGRVEHHIKPISVHNTKHLKPLSAEHHHFGHYLAGLIDGNGHFISTPTGLLFYLSFNIKDISLAFFIKKNLGFGKISFAQSNHSFYCTLTVSKIEGILRVLHLINGKLRTLKFSHLFNTLNSLSPSSLSSFSLLLDSHFLPNFYDNFNNYWLSGYTDANGSFQIKMEIPTSYINPSKKWVSETPPEISLIYQIHQFSNEFPIFSLL
jgi:hypothetical protein